MRTATHCKTIKRPCPCEVARGRVAAVLCFARIRARDEGAALSSSDRLRLLPAVDQVLRHPDLARPLERLPREVVVRAVQEEVDRLRDQLRGEAPGPDDRDAARAGVARAAAT